MITRVDKKESEPAHLQVRRHLLDLIEQGQFKIGDQIPGEPDIARMVGVSRMTANKAILSLVDAGWLVRERGRGTFVSTPPKATGRVVVGFRHDAGHSKEDYYFGALYWGIHDVLTEQGLNVEVARFTQGSLATLTEVSGMIAISPSQRDLDELASLSRRGVTVMIIGASWAGQGMSFVDSDNILGASLAVSHLAELGHRRILFLGAEPNDSNTIDRVRGFTTTMKSRGLDFRPSDVIVTEFAEGFDDDLKRRLRQILAEPDRPTAVFAAGAKIALQLKAKAAKLDIRIPDQLSLVAYDDPEFLQLSYPPVTTVAQPLAQMARAATMRLLDEAGSPQPTSQKIFDPELIIRGTTAVPFTKPLLETP
jgi:DNA-binding LacI/PurR family transcriptional regulator